MASSSGQACAVTTTNLSTKELARSLGLIRKLSSSSQKTSKTRLKQSFSYLVVIDFESTCWKDKKTGYAPEIIEFPAVLVNTSTGVIESEFCHYVQPSEHRWLTDFCKELTGITQVQVENGIPIGTCLMLFKRWLDELSDKKNIKFLSRVLKSEQTDQKTKDNAKWCTFVTWSDWDIGICLKNECQRKRHIIHPSLRSWIDLRAAYKTFYSRKPNGLAGSLKELGIQFAGRQHSGLDDARNTAKLAMRMIRDGCVLNITSSIDASVTVLHQIIQNGFKRSNTEETPKEHQTFFKTIQRMTDSQSKHVTGFQKPISPRKSYFKDIESDCASFSLESSENLIRDTNFVPKIVCPSVHSLVSPSVSVAGLTSHVGGAHDYLGTRALVSPVTCLTGLNNQCCPGNQSRFIGEGNTRNSAVLKRKSRDLSSPIEAKRGLVKQTLGIASSSVTCSPRARLSAVNAHGRGNELKRESKGSNVDSGVTFKTSRLVDRSSVMSNRHFDFTWKSRESDRTSMNNGYQDNKENNTEGKIKEPNSSGRSFVNIKPWNVTNRGNVTPYSCKKHIVTPSSGKITSLNGMVTPLNRLVTPLNGMVTPLNRLVTPPNGMVTPLNGMVTPLNGMVTPLNRLVTPLNGVVMPFNRMVTPPNGMVTPPNGMVTPLNEMVTPLRYNGGSVTPPLCECGRRSRRLTVGKAGPNQGRVFYACSVRKNGSCFGKPQVKKAKDRTGCKFFCWQPKNC